MYFKHICFVLLINNYVNLCHKNVLTWTKTEKSTLAEIYYIYTI